MKKIAIALVAFSIVFTACSAVSSNSEDTKLEVSVEKISEENELTNEGVDQSSTETESVSNTDISNELLGEFDVLEHHDYDFSKITYKKAETKKNIMIENIVKETFFSESENPEYSYTYNYTNLNDDEYEDIIVLLGGMEFAGSGGSTVLILKGEAEENFSLINKVTLARTPILVTNTVSNGYKDLMFVVYGGGSETLHNMLRYDGLEYPLNPSVQLQAESGRIFEGEAIIANTEYYKTLIQAGSVK